jgi:hypothetical protein
LLEIGCGTGLLLHRLAPATERYVGTDISPAAIALLTDQAPGAELLHREATDFGGFDTGAFDTVVINSVVQYFPSAAYLLDVVAGAVDVTADGGSVFVGDVRSLALLEAFHASVELFQTNDDAGREELLERVRRRVDLEEQLVLDPRFFLALRDRFDRVSRVEIVPHRGRTENELTKYRYDAILRVGGETAGAEPAWTDWAAERPALDAIRARLQGRPDGLALAGVPNGRVARDVEIVEQLGRADGPERAGVLREVSGAGGLHVDDLCALGAELGYRVELS